MVDRARNVEGVCGVLDLSDQVGCIEKKEEVVACMDEYFPDSMKITNPNLSTNNVGKPLFGEADACYKKVMGDEEAVSKYVKKLLSEYLVNKAGNIENEKIRLQTLAGLAVITQNVNLLKETVDRINKYSKDDQLQTLDPFLENVLKIKSLPAEFLLICYRLVDNDEIKENILFNSYSESGIIVCLAVEGKISEALKWIEKIKNPLKQLAALYKIHMISSDNKIVEYAEEISGKVQDEIRKKHNPKVKYFFSEVAKKFKSRKLLIAAAEVAGNNPYKLPICESPRIVADMVEAGFIDLAEETARNAKYPAVRAYCLSVIAGMCREKDKAKQLFEEAIKIVNDKPPTNDENLLKTIIVENMVKADFLELAEKLAEETWAKNTTKDDMAYSAIAKGYAVRGDWKTAMYIENQKVNIPLNKGVDRLIMEQTAQQGDLEKAIGMAREIHSMPASEALIDVAKITIKRNPQGGYDSDKILGILKEAVSLTRHHNIIEKSALLMVECGFIDEALGVAEAMSKDKKSDAIFIVNGKMCPDAILYAGSVQESAVKALIKMNALKKAELVATSIIYDENRAKALAEVVKEFIRQEKFQDATRIVKTFSFEQSGDQMILYRALVN